jgi:hypothetical protein
LLLLFYSRRDSGLFFFKFARWRVLAMARAPGYNRTASKRTLYRFVGYALVWQTGRHIAGLRTPKVQEQLFEF